MIPSADMCTFKSRVRFQGVLKFDTAFRIGAAKSTRVDEPDTPILRDALGRPYIPGASLKGALRSYIESLARSLQSHAAIKDRNLACMVFDKSEPRQNGDLVCLHQDEVSILKTVPIRKWLTSNELSDSLKQRITNLIGSKDLADLTVDQTLRDLSCWTCRLFGSPWLASKIFIRDLPLADELVWPREIRDGVGIDRDAGRAAAKIKYQFEVLPSGSSFDLEFFVENASEAELGLLWLGVSALERGEILMGGGRSRGLGWCKLALDWQKSCLIDGNNLLTTLFLSPSRQGDPLNPSNGLQWMRSFAQVIGAVEFDGGEHA